ncbi:CCA tRNA nucleotidyltransferase [Clostridium sp. MB05]
MKVGQIMHIFIPNEVDFIIDTFYRNNFKAFMVGGCVRDSLLGISPKDYDITTSAKPDTTLSLFEKTIPTGLKHGTVTVIISNNQYEVTTFRTEGTYLDNRRPSSVEFVSDIKEDLSRRDFTINALAYNKSIGLIDYFGGIDDINNKIIRCVGNPDERFKEDSLRMLRAIRFSCQLDFNIDEITYKAIINNNKLVSNISHERVRDELCKILISNNSSKGLVLLKNTGLLEIILPEIHSLTNFTPKCNNHNKDVFSHTLKVIDNTYNNLLLRLSALLHDVGKLNTLTFNGNGSYYFPNHNIESSIMARNILSKLRFDNNTINIVCKLIEHHLVLDVNYLPTKFEVKKLLNVIGKDNIGLLFDLQRADINSLDNPKIFLAKVDYMDNLVDEILNNNEPLSIKDLHTSGEILIKNFNLKPGKLIGDTLSFLLNKVLENPSLNDEESLFKLAKEFIYK